MVKRTLNAENLESLGAGVLAQLLMEVSSGNAVIQRRLRLALAAAEGASGAAQEVLLPVRPADTGDGRGPGRGGAVPA